MSEVNYFEVLGVGETSTQDEIKKAYRNLAKEHHPDKGGDEKKFKSISEAYDTLGNENKRKEYAAALLQQKKINKDKSPFQRPRFSLNNPYDFWEKFTFENQQIYNENPDKIYELNCVLRNSQQIIIYLSFFSKKKIDMQSFFLFNILVNSKKIPICF
jgi:DnaJ-class molecular chaperone